MPSLAHYTVDLIARSLLSSDPPARRTRQGNHATLLVSWWCTIFALFIILARLGGRWTRSEVLFREDKVMAFSIIPLMLRMGCAHVLLLFGTNNADTTGISVNGAANRELGSKVVLASRILYALFIWSAKFTVAEFLRRLATAIWTPTYEKVLRGIRWFLIVTFIGVVLAILFACRPFHENWQVLPIPKPQCRTGFAQVLTMGTADIVTDILLIAFPIPIVLRSSMPVKRKMSLVFLFSLSFLLIAVTAYRMFAIIQSAGRQQLRTLWASIEILAAAAVSNFLVIGSFMRDRGVKKTRYRPPSTEGSLTDSAIQPSITRKMTLQHWGSDEDLFRTLGCRVHSFENPDAPIPRVAGAERTRQPSDLVLLDPLSHAVRSWVPPNGDGGGSLDGSSSTLDSDAITSIPHSSNDSSRIPSDSNSRPTTRNSLVDGTKPHETLEPPAPFIRAFDFATQHTPRDTDTTTRGRTSFSPGELFPHLYSPSAHSQASSPSRIHNAAGGSRSHIKPPVLHHPDYTSYQRGGEDQILGDAGGLLGPATPMPSKEKSKDIRRGSVLSKMYELTPGKGRRSSSQTTSPVSPMTSRAKAAAAWE